LQVFEVVKDGDCLFDCVRLHLSETRNLDLSCQEIRKQVTNYLAQNTDACVRLSVNNELAVNVESSKLSLIYNTNLLVKQNSNPTWDDYLAFFKTTKTFPEAEHIAAICLLYNINIEIYTYFNGLGSSDKKIDNPSSTMLVALNDKHYRYVIPISQSQIQLKQQLQQLQNMQQNHRDQLKQLRQYYQQKIQELTQRQLKKQQLKQQLQQEIQQEIQEFNQRSQQNIQELTQQQPQQQLTQQQLKQQQQDIEQ
jgi:hypothetical protein